MGTVYEMGGYLVDGGDCGWLDALVSACTAYHSLSEMSDAMAGGYVPTIYPRSRRAIILRRVMRSLEMPVWPVMRDPWATAGARIV